MIDEQLELLRLQQTEHGYRVDNATWPERTRFSREFLRRHTGKGTIGIGDLVVLVAVNGVATYAVTRYHRPPKNYYEALLTMEQMDDDLHGAQGPMA
jgi:hypothetical protein